MVKVHHQSRYTVRQVCGMCVLQEEICLICQKEVLPSLRLLPKTYSVDLPKGTYCRKIKFQFRSRVVPKEMSEVEMNGSRPTSSAPVQLPCTSASTHDIVFGGSEPNNNDCAEDRVDCSVAPSRAGSNTTRSVCARRI